MSKSDGKVVIGGDDLSQGLAASRQAEREAIERLGAKIQHFDGVCPFLTCLLANPHDHGICPDCGAVRFGNISCATCRSVHERAMQISKRGMREVAKRVSEAEQRVAEFRERMSESNEAERKADQDSN